MLAEHDASTGSVNREYVWIDDLPVALLDISGGTVTTDFIHTGQIDEPLMVTDRGRGDRVGCLRRSLRNGHDVQRAFNCALLFAYRASSSRPKPMTSARTTGATTTPALGGTSKPSRLGINAGPNIYAYVNGDPLMLTDPSGRFYWLIPILVGAAFDAAGEA